MIHIFYGEDKNNINFEKSLILMNKQPIKINFNDNHDEIIDNINQTSLFNDNNIFLIDESSFLSCKKNQDIELVNKLSKSHKEIYCFEYSDKINLKLQNVTYHKISKFNNLSKQKLISQLSNNLKINFDNPSTKQYLESTLDNDPFVVTNELTKLSLSSNTITKQTIDNSISPHNNPNVFKIMTFLLTNDKKKLIELYDNLILSKFLPIDLISIINTQLLNLKIYKLAKINHFTNTDIISKLCFNQYVMMQFDSFRIDINKINELINNLWELEYNMKHKNINQYLGLKFFLAK